MKTYPIHPVSLKYLKAGHPWVTLDQFSKKFDEREKFIVAQNNAAMLLHDPKHKQVRARLWSLKGNFKAQIQNFDTELKSRITTAIDKRSYLEGQRENYYLCFAESDFLPGLFIIKLKDRILIQYFSYFWTAYQKQIMAALRERFKDLPNKNFWIQMRAGKQMPPQCLVSDNKADEFILEEFGVKYKIFLGNTYDHGLYTDMSGIRNNMLSFIGQSKKFLNLFSYTGAYSLFALKNGVQEVHSVDLSKKYLSWLEENLELNEFQGEHISHCAPVQNQLKAFKQDNIKFDFILSDPPTSSSDGKKKTNALSNYSTELPLMYDILEKGGYLAVFLNTHQVSSKKFQQKIMDILKQHKLKLKQIKTYKLSDDCPTLKGFPEGNYLKGILLQKL